MNFFDWVVLIDCVSVVIIVWLIVVLSLSWRAEQSYPDPAPVVQDLASALGRGSFRDPIRALLTFVSSQRRRLKRSARSLRTRFRGTVSPEADPGRAVGGLPDVAAAE